MPKWIADKRIGHRGGRLALSCLFLAAAGCRHSEPRSSSPSAMDAVILAIDTPSAGWSARPVEAWATSDRVFCLFELRPPEGMAAQVITKIQSRMSLPKSGLPKQIVVLGKTWNWSPDTAIVYPESRDAFIESLPESASRIEIGIANP